MARTIKEIKKTMTDQFMADSTVRTRYGLTGSSSFDETFSSVSIENIIFFIVASAMYVLETIFDSFKTEVDSKVATAVLASIPWYHQICLEYQQGDELIFDETTQQFRYPSVDESKRVVKYAACRDRGGGVLILVSGEGEDGIPAALSDDILVPFKSYINSRKPAGIPAEIRSYNPDQIQIGMTVQYDPMLMNADGTLVADPSVFPVEEAVSRYLQGIVYGGIFNKTKLVDAIQETQGVEDVMLLSVSAKSDTTPDFASVSGNNYTAVSGSFKAVNLKNSISYATQI